MTPQDQLSHCLSLKNNSGNTVFQDGYLLGLIAVTRLINERMPDQFLPALIVHRDDLIKRSDQSGTKQKRHLAGQIRAFSEAIDELNPLSNENLYP